MNAPDSPLRRLLHTPPATPAAPCRVADVLAGRPVVVYGCGDGLITFSVFVLDKFGIRPEVCLDAKFTAPTTLGDIPAMAPADYRPDPALLDRAVAVVTVGKTRFHADIFATLRGLGFTRIVLASDLYEYHLSHAPAGFEQLGQAWFAERADAIERAYALLADAKSRSVFEAVLQTHVAQMPVPIPRDPLEHQYFPHDVPLAAGVARTLNCGAYDGDTVRQLHARHGRIEALACFEPDLPNFTRLRATLTEHAGQLAGTVMAFPCGVLDDDVQLRFAGGNRINSTLSDDGDTVVQCVALDHVLPDFRPTFINMDIEGAEPHALHGARQLIRANRPDLAICVYHHPAHLWEIALQIHALVPDYRFYLRNYTGFPAETVLYASR